MANKKRKYKRREDFTDEEWKKLRIKALKLNIERGWGYVRIARELGISHNTVSSWLYDYGRLGRIGEFKRRGNFNDEEWKRKIIEAWRLKAEKGWGRIKIGRELGISPNTIGCWINNGKTPTKKVINELTTGLYKYRLTAAKRMVEEWEKKGVLSEETAEEMLVFLEFCYQIAPYYLRKERIEKEGDDSYLIYS